MTILKEHWILQATTKDHPEKKISIKKQLFFTPRKNLLCHSLEEGN